MAPKNLFAELTRAIRCYGNQLSASQEPTPNADHPLSAKCRRYMTVRIKPDGHWCRRFSLRTAFAAGYAFAKALLEFERAR
jgi:hypothetical protein